MGAVRRPLPKKLGKHVEGLLRLFREIWLGSVDKSATHDGEVPLSGALRSALHPLGNLLSEVLGLVALSQTGRLELAKEIEELRNKLRQLDSENISNFADKSGPLSKAYNPLRTPASSKSPASSAST